VALRLGLIGFGGVNRALVDLLQSRGLSGNGEFIITAVYDLRSGSAFDRNGIDFAALSSAGTESDALHAISEHRFTDGGDLVGSDAVDVIVEASYTNAESGEPALSLCRRALDAGKHVVTTNKGPVAFGLRDLTGLAKVKRKDFLFEGAVMSGTPVLRTIRNCLPGARVNGFRAILNGTSNYILARMESGQSFPDALKEAQSKGYAEADPTADIEGADVALKVAILANLLFGTDIRPHEISCSGISGLTPEMAIAAREDGMRWKLIGQASRLEDGSYRAQVGAMKLMDRDPLASVNGVTNAITLLCDPLGPVTICGPGAGRVETAYAILSDLLDIASHI
jgi:homoserine dehydrogenase